MQTDRTGEGEGASDRERHTQIHKWEIREPGKHEDKTDLTGAKLREGHGEKTKTSTGPYTYKDNLN